MDDQTLEQAAGLLAAARLSGEPLGPLPEACRPGDEATAYRLQERVHDSLAAAGLGSVAGIKIGCTTPVMQHYLGIDHPCAGGILSSGVRRGEGTFRLAQHRRLGVECELAVVLERSLGAAGAPYRRHDVVPALGVCMAAIEVVDDRYQDYSRLGVWTLVADDFFNAGCVVGETASDWRGLDLARISGSLTVDGRELGRGRGSAILGHPLDALAWLANLAARYGRTLPAGSVVLLGSVVRTHWLEGPAEVAVAMEGLGEARASFL